MNGCATVISSVVIRAAGVTDVGCVRPYNEDSLLVGTSDGMFIVTDGVGGRAYGDVAARMVVEQLPLIIGRRMQPDAKMPTGADGHVSEVLSASVNEMTREIRAWSGDTPGSRGMGATVVVVLVRSGHAHIVHMGDSRGYLFRDNAIRQLTEDHSIVGMLVQHGEITHQEAEHHPAKGRLTRYVGMEADVDPDVQTLPLHVGDRLLLCTDGVWGMLTETDMVGILSKRETPERTCGRLVEAGKKAGGADNLTAIVVDYGSGLSCVGKPTEGTVQ